MDRYNFTVDELSQLLNEHGEDLEHRSRVGEISNADADRLYRHAKARMGLEIQRAEIRHQECELASLDKHDEESAAREEEASIRNFRSSLLLLRGLNR